MRHFTPSDPPALRIPAQQGREACCRLKVALLQAHCCSIRGRTLSRSEDSRGCMPGWWRVQMFHLGPGS